MPKYKTIDDLTGEEKNEIVKVYTSPSEEKMLKMIEHIQEAQGIKFVTVDDFHQYIKEHGNDQIKAYYGFLFGRIFSEKDKYIVEYLEQNPIEKD